jgi:uncharacterized protein YbjT (DUF2867 family)
MLALVAGANGFVGGHVAELLRTEGADVRAAGRRGPFPLDLTQPESVERAADGVDVAFLVWPLFDAVHAPAAIDALARHARRIVYISSTSVRAELDEQVHPYAAFHAEIERLLAASGSEWTVVRATWLAKNARFWSDVPAARFSFPDARRSPIDERDVAAVAVRALLDGNLASRTLIVTGPESMREADIYVQLRHALGLEARAERITPAEERGELLADGASVELAEATVAHRRRLVTHPEPITETVREVAGAPACTFRDYLARI